MSVEINFPFERDKWYSIGELRAFGVELFRAHQKDSNLSARVRGRKLWAKLWCEELFPIECFANHHKLPDTDRFRAMPDGSPVDVELNSLGAITRFQITEAYANWDGSGDEARSGGYIRSLERAGVNQGIPVFGGGRTRREAGGRIISTPRGRSPDVNRRAWQAGLIQAVKRKIDMADKYQGKVDLLLIYAERLRFNTIYEKIEAVVISALERIENIDQSPFKKIVVLDYDPLCYVEYPTGVHTYRAGHAPLLAMDAPG